MKNGIAEYEYKADYQQTKELTFYDGWCIVIYVGQASAGIAEGKGNMERLTEMNGSKTAHFYPQCFEICGGTGYKQECNDCEISDKACEKLGEYEDLEEHGKLLKPKCLPGDYVWEVNRERNIISEYQVASIRYGINKTFRYMWALREGIYGDLDGFRDTEIGKTVFLTKEEAEAALKAMSK